MRLLAFDPGDVLVTALGADDWADLFAERRRVRTVHVEGDRVDVATELRSAGLGLRVARGRDVRMASTTRLDHGDALTLASRLARGGPRRSGAALAEFTSHAVVVDEPIDARPLAERVALAEGLARLVRGMSPRIAHVSVSLVDEVRDTEVARTDRRAVAQRVQRSVLSLEVVARDGARVERASESIGGVGGLERVGHAEAERAARTAASRALRLLGAPPAPAGDMPVILAAEAGGTFVHEAVGHPLEADLVLDELSLFRDAVGAQIASPLVTVVDDPTLPGAHGSFFVDDEGEPAQRSVLVDRGRLVAFLGDRASARALPTARVGHARRESYAAPPIVRMSNTLIAPGVDDPADILRDTPSGLYVTRVGGGEVDTVSGQFVFEAVEAYRIERGVVGDLVRGATLVGDVRSALEAIDRVGRDLGLAPGVCGKDGQDVPVADGEPTLRIARLTIGGG